MIVTTPQTGEVVAIVGGRRASFDGFNRALDAKRPIGSLAKPLVYLAALETGRYTPASVVHDQAVEIKLPNGDTWKPANFDKEIRGDMPAVRALTQSLNLPTVNLGLEVGLARVARTFVQLGLEEKPAEYPSMLLGATNLSPIEVAQHVQHARERRLPFAAARRARGACRVRQAVEGAAARGGGGGAGGCGLHGRPHAGRSHGARHRAARAQGPAAGAGRGGQDRHVERLPRQLVRGLLGRAPDRRVDGTRRQFADRPHRYDGRARRLVEADVLDPDHVVRPVDAGIAGEPVDRLLLGPRDIAVLRRLRGEHAVQDRNAAVRKRCVSARRGGSRSKRIRPRARGRVPSRMQDPPPAP